MNSALLIFKDTGIQFFWLFGSFLLGGVALSLLARWTNNIFRQFALPRLGLLAFGAIGIAFHELSHAFFCKLFLHEIQSVKLFDLKGKNGAQGSVTHTYHPFNPYQRLGHFFIGLGPIIMAPIVFALLFYALVPAARPLLASGFPHSAIEFTRDMLSTLAHKRIFSSIGFWIFAYLALCISSQIELSREDWNQVHLGIIPIAIVLLVINLAIWAFHLSWHEHIVNFGHALTAVTTSFFCFAAALGVANLIVCTLIFSGLHLVGGKEAINPFKS